MQEREYWVEYICVDCKRSRRMKLQTVGGKEIHPGCLNAIICSDCDDLAKKEASVKWNREKKLARLEKAGFPLDKAAAWSYSNPKRNGALEDWIQENIHDALWIAGYPQIGKTFAVLKTAREELEERRRFVRWIQGSELFGGYVDSLRESSARGAAYIRGLLGVDLLVIDDIDDPGKFTFTGGQLIYKLLDGVKNDRSKRIWITSNILKSEFRKMFESDNHGAKVEERLRDRFKVWSPQNKGSDDGRR